MGENKHCDIVQLETDGRHSNAGTEWIYDGRIWGQATGELEQLYPKRFPFIPVTDRD